MTRNQGGLLAVLTCVLLLAWLTAGSRPSPPRSAMSPVEGPSVLADPALASLPGQAARLRAHIGATAPLVSSRRNPFQFGNRAAPPSRRRAAAAEAQGEPAAGPAFPEMQLLGIAEDLKDGTAARTAIVSAGGQLHLLAEGESVLGWQIQRIGADAVHLRHGEQTASLTLK